MRTLRANILVITLLLIFAAVPLSAQESFIIKNAPEGKNTNPGIASDGKNQLLYWENNGAIYTNLLKYKKKSDTYKLANRPTRIKPDKGVYRRPHIAYYSPAKAYILAVDTSPVDLSAPAATAPSAKKTHIILIQLSKRGKPKGEPTTIASDRKTNLSPFIVTDPETHGGAEGEIELNFVSWEHFELERDIRFTFEKVLMEAMTTDIIRYSRLRSSRTLIETRSDTSEPDGGPTEVDGKIVERTKLDASDITLPFPSQDPESLLSVAKTIDPLSQKRITKAIWTIVCDDKNITFDFTESLGGGSTGDPHIIRLSPGTDGMPGVFLLKVLHDADLKDFIPPKVVWTTVTVDCSAGMVNQTADWFEAASPVRTRFASNFTFSPPSSGGVSGEVGQVIQLINGDIKSLGFGLDGQPTLGVFPAFDPVPIIDQGQILFDENTGRLSLFTVPTIGDLGVSIVDWN